MLDTPAHALGAERVRRSRGQRPAAGPGGHVEVRTPPRALASCRGMESMAACGDASRTTWSAAADIASWACGGMTWSCSQMMYVAGCAGWGAVLGGVMLDTDVST